MSSAEHLRDEVCSPSIARITSSGEMQGHVSNLRDKGTNTQVVLAGALSGLIARYVSYLKSLWVMDSKEYHIVFV